MWSDRETEHDFLGYDSYVKVLSEICLHPDLAPLTMGIFGAWGSGKSSLMRMLKAHIDAQVGEGDDDRSTKTLEFNAWRYEGREEAQSALIHAILAKLQEGQTLGQEMVNLFGTLKRNASVLKLAKFTTKSLMTMTPDIGGFIDCFQKESEEVAKTMQRFESDFSECLAKMQIERIVVFIDDLDRCSDAKVIETFETIKLFLNVPACTFVIGADDERIKECVGSVYGVADEGRRKDFLEKIIQIPFSIPEQTLADIRCFVGMLVVDKYAVAGSTEHVSGARSDLYNANDAAGYATWVRANANLFEDGADDVLSELESVLPFVELFGSGLRGNPRQIKRFLNILSLRRRLAETNALAVETGLLVKLCVLEYVWDRFFHDVARTIDPATGNSELIAEVLRSAEAVEASESGLADEWGEHPGLVEFLKSEPCLDGSQDLGPYLFLAQTSLGRAEARQLLPAEERAEGLITDIMAQDRVVSRSGARKTVAEEGAVVAAVVRGLCSRLGASGNERTLTLMISALSTICQSCPTHFNGVVRALEGVEPKGHDGICLAGSTLLEEAQSNGVEVDAALKDRFSSELAKKLAPARGRRRGRGI